MKRETVPFSKTKNHRAGGKGAPVFCKRKKEASKKKKPPQVNEGGEGPAYLERESTFLLLTRKRKKRYKDPDQTAGSKGGQRGKTASQNSVRSPDQRWKKKRTMH